MANNIDFGPSGEDLNAWMTSSLEVYTNATNSSTMQSIGKAEKEVTVTPETEVAEWFDNVNGVQTLYTIDINKTGM